MATQNYHTQLAIQQEKKIQQLLKTLPAFCTEYFCGIEPVTMPRTRLAYAYDLTIFFDFLEKNKKTCQTLDDLDRLTTQDLELYLSYLKVYEKEGVAHQNEAAGRKRKMVAVRSLYQYFFQKEKIKNNPAARVAIPKRKEKEIVRLEVDEVAKLLDAVESGADLSKAQQKYHKKTRARDLALLTLLLGTGIRISECVGLNLEDFDFENNRMKIQRKGGAETVLYFSEEVKEALLPYLEKRKTEIVQTGHESAFFLSMQKKRCSVRTIENLVKKYAQTVTTLKHITPHKLRSTYGTSLYRETGDIYLVADVLGHKDVNTTKKHYAAIEEDRKRMAAQMVTLREKR